MAYKPIDIGSKKFSGERRDVSTVKRLFEACELALNISLFPLGRVSKRAGYEKLYHSTYVYNSNPNAELASPSSLPTAITDTTHDPRPANPKEGLPSVKQLGVTDITLPSGVIAKLAIKAIHEYPMPTAFGIEQRHVVQMNDERFYKYIFGANAGWVALENTYQSDNVTDWYRQRLAPAVVAGGLAITAAPVLSTPRARFWDENGVLRAGIGNGAGKTPIVYNWIDRYFFTNDDGDLDPLINNKYTDNHLDVTPLQPPRDVNTYNNELEDNGGVWDADFKMSVSSNELFTTTNIPEQLPARYNARGYALLRRWYSEATAKDIEAKICRWADADINHRNKTWNDNINWIDLHKGGGVPAEPHLAYYYIGLSFMYDGYQESQIHVLTPNYASNFNWLCNSVAGDAGAGKCYLDIPGTIVVGVTDRRHLVHRESYSCGSFISVKLRLGKLSLQTVDGNHYPDQTNPRITGVRIWMAQLSDKNDKAKDLLFYPVKLIAVSGLDTFKNEPMKGDHEWTVGTGDPDGFDANYYHCLAIIDANDWLAGLSSGESQQIMGHSLTLEDATKKLTAAPFLESYRSAHVVNGTPYYAGIRLGVFRPQENEFATIWATRFGDAGGGTQAVSTTTPDIVNPELAYVAKGRVMNLRKLDDDTLAIVTENAVINFDVYRGRVSDTNAGGTTSPDSVVTEQNKVILYREGEISRYDGVAQSSASDAIKKNDDGAVYKGLEGAYDDTTVHSFYSKQLEKLFVFIKLSASVWTTFVFDYTIGVKQWIRYEFAHSFVCGCIGVDGELDFSDGTYIYRHPLGLSDAGSNIIWTIKSADVNWDSKIELVLHNVYAYFKSTTSNVTATITRDRGNLTGTSISLDSQATPNDVTKPVNMTKNRCKQTVSITLQSTVPSTTEVVEIEKVSIECDPKSRSY